MDFADEWAGSQDWKATTREAWPMLRARLVPHLGQMPLRVRKTGLASEHRSSRSSTDAGPLEGRYARTTVETTMAYEGVIMRAALCERADRT